MFPSTRSFIIFLGCLIAIGFFAVTIFLNIWDVLYAVICVEDRVVEVTSPEGRYVARSVRSNCGSISPFTTRVYTRTAGWGITRLRPDLVFLCRGEPDDLHLRWVTTQDLVIEHNACYAVIGPNVRPGTT